jgi:hypothetical protein
MPQTCALKMHRGILIYKVPHKEKRPRVEYSRPLILWWVRTDLNRGPRDYESLNSDISERSAPFPF